MKKVRDPDYNPEDDYGEKRRKIIRKSNPKPKTKPMNKKKSERFLTQNAPDIVKEHKLGKEPHEIADYLEKKHNLPDGRSISNWLYYHGKSKQLKLRSVSPKNKNMRATGLDSCVFHSLFCFIASFFSIQNFSIL